MYDTLYSLPRLGIGGTQIGDFGLGGGAGPDEAQTGVAGGVSGLDPKTGGMDVMGIFKADNDRLRAFGPGGMNATPGNTLPFFSGGGQCSTLD